MRSSSSSSSRSNGMDHYKPRKKIQGMSDIYAELPSDYYKELFFKIHGENKMLKKNMAKNMCKNMAKNMIKSNSDEGGILEKGELKEEFTLIKSTPNV
ncbi:hypothetical protein Tco_0655175 [Tanacetum coccineum]|uniref:Uncharacterized protein n=1 Tax=Tanacetum coccineum TaxID=301880 RepID=A0ABQ4X6D2_9ASTR